MRYPTTLSQLQVGDKFYFSALQKNVFQLKSLEKLDNAEHPIRAVLVNVEHGNECVERKDLHCIFLKHDVIQP